MKYLLIVVVAGGFLSGNPAMARCSTPTDALDQETIFYDKFKTFILDHPDKVSGDEQIYFIQKGIVASDRIGIAVHRDDGAAACKAEADYEAELTPWVKQILER
jgi:hypothetical protein